MRSFSFILSLFFLTSVSAQEIQMSETASLEQIYGEVQEAEELLPMNEDWDLSSDTPFMRPQSRQRRRTRY